MDFFAAWGWDATDLVWEAGVLLPDGETVRVLRLADDAGLQGIVDSFRTLGFEQQNGGGVEVFTYPQAPPESWLAGSEQRHAAIIADDHVLLHASSPEALQQVIDARLGASQSWADLPAFSSLAPDLEQMIKAEVISGQFMCARWSIESWLKDAAADAPLRVELERLQAEGVEYRDLHDYDAFAMGYRFEGEETLGVIAMHFSSEGEADADVELRSRLLTEGNSLAMRTGVPYSRALLELIEAEARDGAIYLQVKPNAASLLWGALQTADMTYAFCP